MTTPKTTRELATAIGVAPSVVLELRARLTKGLHWNNDPEDGRRILWSETGERAVLEALGLAEPAPTFDTCDPVILEGTVHSKAPKPGLPHFPNDRVLRVQTDDGEVRTIWVRSSRNFQPQLQGGAPMRVRVTMRGGRWELADQRCPRWPGKW